MQIAAQSDLKISPTNPVLPTTDSPIVVWDQLHGCADALALASAVQKGKHLWVVISIDYQTALRLEHELEVFIGSTTIPILHFPDWETLPYDVFSPLPEIISERLKTLARLPQIDHGVLIVTIGALMQRLAPKQHILANSFAIEAGIRINLDEIRRQLEQVGYQCVSQVYQHGEFAIRGSIIDLFPMGSSIPYRIELFDDEVESIRTFDPETQRSLEKVGNISLFPAREFPFTEEAIRCFRRTFRTRFPKASERNSLYLDVSKGIASGGIEYYLPLFVDHTETLFDYFPANVVLVLPDSTLNLANEFYLEVERIFEQRRHDLGRPLLAPEEVFLKPQDLKCGIDNVPQVHIMVDDVVTGSPQGLVVSYTTQPLPDVSLQPNRKNPSEVLMKFVEDFPGKVLFVAESAGHREMMVENLGKFGLLPKKLATWKEFLRCETSPCIIVAPMDHGLVLENPAIAIITESQLTGERAKQRRRRRRSSSRDMENIVNNLNELNVESPVVHQDHGVGRYKGLQKLNIGGIETEFLTLEYANQDKLYVPVSALHLIGRYNGASSDTAPLHKLGGDKWDKAKRKALERVRDVAAELLDISAKRAAKTGSAFEVDQEEYQAFASAFPFEETPDQEAAIEQVIADMVISQPMDRVICGDVGFGKTEVAMRAAFLAIQNNKQVAILVPTTLLAQQHFQNFCDRFADWPVRTEVLSRFVSKKKQNEIIQAIFEGKVDILIGTHKLIQKEIVYRSLGLVIIDEEHRFGVRHKEHFKKLRSEVDLLTLTATPIPRTLNMAMSGLRAISIIASPPLNRHAIKTFVSEWNDALVQEACLREIRRGGQVFFLHNEIKSMERMSRDLAKLLPQARIAIAHGQMPERELEQIMLDFYHQRFNLLICSTIIESGIDVPTANTIIINRADKLGLAQLHQLRGRVGRSHHRAYAYLIVPPEKLMTRDAVKRLEAIQAAGDLGAGFMLSSHDMEIRGAGELLGGEQSGQIQEIGFTLYTELLERAVAALKSGKQPEMHAPLESGPEVDLRLAALIPDDYLPDVHTRLVFYKRIATARTHDELWDLQVEMIDRFGLLPEAGKNLFGTTEIKLKASKLGIRKIDSGPTAGRIIFNSEPDIDPAKIIKLIQSRSEQVQMDGPDKLRFQYQIESAQQKISFISELLDNLSHHPSDPIPQ